jgi:hypothetical protein
MTKPSMLLPGETPNEMLVRVTATVAASESRFRAQLRELCGGEPSPLVLALADAGFGAARTTFALVAARSGDDDAFCQSVADVAMTLLERAEATARGEGRRRTRRNGSGPVPPRRGGGVRFEATPSEFQPVQPRPTERSER